MELCWGQEQGTQEATAVCVVSREEVRGSGISRSLELPGFRFSGRCVSSWLWASSLLYLFLCPSVD